VSEEQEISWLESCLQFYYREVELFRPFDPVLIFAITVVSKRAVFVANPDRHDDGCQKCIHRKREYVTKSYGQRDVNLIVCRRCWLLFIREAVLHVKYSLYGWTKTTE
jgi:hypothetical protein